MKNLNNPSGSSGKSKLGPGQRAKVDARAKNSKSSGSCLIPGADAFVPPSSSRSQRGLDSNDNHNSASSKNLPQSFNGRSSTATKVKKWSDGSNRQRRSEPLVIESNDQKTKVVVTQKDIKKWMTQKDRVVSKDNRFNQGLLEGKIRKTIKYPDQILEGNDIHNNQNNCKVYIIKDDGENFAVIVNSNTGRAILGSTLSSKEYKSLKNDGKIDLSNMSRDPQTRIINSKSENEFETLIRAQDEGLLKDLEVRRPYNITESMSDFVGETKNGKKTDIEIKRMDGYAKKTTLGQHTTEIARSIEKSLKVHDQSYDKIVICDLSPLPNTEINEAYKMICEKLNESEIGQVKFLYY